MALAHQPRPVLPIGDFWCLYPTNFPDHNTAQHSCWSSSQTLFLKPPLPSWWPTIPFSTFFFPDNLHFWGKFCLTLLRIHPTSLGFFPFQDIGDLLYIVYHLSHPNTIRMCDLPAFLGDICLWQLWNPYTYPLPTSLLLLPGATRHIPPLIPGIYLLNFRRLPIHISCTIPLIS